MRPRSVPFATIALLLLLASAARVCAQSIALTETQNSLVTQSRARFSSSGFESIAIGSGYSISGVLEIGLAFHTGGVGSTERITDIGMLYAVTPLKQSRLVPVSAQIFGSYAYRFARSDFLSDNRLAKEGTGYSVGLLIARDIVLVDWFTLRLGAVAEFANVSTVTGATFVVDPADLFYLEYPLIEQNTELLLGPYVAVVASISPAATIGIGIAVEFADTGVIRYRPELHVALSR